MIRVSAKITSNTASLALDGLVEAFEDQQEMNRLAMSSAEPIADSARANIRKKTGKTHDQITVWADENAPAGTFAVFIGIPGPEVLGRGSRAYIGFFLEGEFEFGSSTRRAFPWLRPANDAEGGPKLVQRFAEEAREYLQRATR